MRSVLVLQFRKNPETRASEEAAIRRAAENLTIDFSFRDALDESTSWSDPETILGHQDALVLGGSGDLDFDGGRNAADEVPMLSRALLERMRPFLEYVFQHDIPTLGICYGHQLIGAFRGAAVTNDTKQSKMGSHAVRLLVDTHDHFLFENLPNEFFAQYGHKDSLDRIPEGATLLMEGEQCKISALRYGKNIFTTQFHPEMRAEDIAERLKHSPGYLPEGVLLEDIVKPSPHAETILKNFLRTVASD